MTDEARASKKEAVDDLIRKLRRWMAEEIDPLMLREKSNELKSLFNEFESAWQVHHESLRDNQKSSSKDYLRKVEDCYISCLKECNMYQKASQTSSPVVIKPENDARDSKDLRIKLPPAPQPEIFSGEKPELFPIWEASFLALIDSHNLDHSEKMYYLKKYVAGEAYSAIESLFLFPCRESYEDAWVILRERFGDPDKVTTALRKKIDAWPQVSSALELRKFSDFLRQVAAAQRKYSALQILDDSFENQKLVAKLPKNVAVKWVEQIVSSKESHKFTDFSNFVKVWADIHNHNLFDFGLSGTGKLVSGGGAANICHITVDSENHQAGVGGAASGDQMKQVLYVVCSRAGHKAPKRP